MNQNDDRDELWNLLGRAWQPVPSPFFARNVLREVRGLRQEGRRPWAGFLLRWQPVAVAVAVLAGGGWAVRSHQRAEEQQQLLSMAVHVYESPDYSVINDLDDLLETEKNSVWLSAEVN